MPVNSLTNKSIGALFWGGGGAVIRIVLQMVAQITLARMLGPTEFGLFTIGVIVVSFSAFFSDVGFAYGLIQKKDVTKEDVRFVVFVQYLLSILVGSGIYFFAAQLAEFFNSTASVNVLRALSLVVMLNALSAVAMNLLKREMNFKVLNIALLIGYFIGYICIGIPLAYAGYGVWSMVCAWIAQALLYLLIIYHYVRHPLTPKIIHSDASAMISYGGKVFFTNVLNWFVNNLDRVIIGKFTGPQQIALYSTPFNLIYSPTSSAIGIVQPVIFSACSRKQDDISIQGELYQGIISVVFLVVMPVFLMVGLLSENIVLLLYGKAWLESAVVLQVIAFAMPCFFVLNLCTPFLWTTNNVSSEMKIQFPMLIFSVALFFLVAKYNFSMLNFSLAVLGVFILRMFLCLFFSSRALNLKCIDVVKMLLPGALLSLLVFVLYVLLSRLFDCLSLGFLSLAMVFFSMVLFVALFPWFLQMCHCRAEQIVDSFVLKMPKKIRPYIQGYIKYAPR